MIGINFTKSYFSDVLFNDCQLAFSNFSDSKLVKVTYDESDLNSLDMIESKVKQLVFHQCNLDNANLTQTNCKKIDFSTCDFNSIDFLREHISGCKFNQYHLVYLAKKFLNVDLA